MVFPDQEGGFLLFQDPVAQFPGEEVAQAEAEARFRHGWLAGGLKYAPAEGRAPGWWGVFAEPRAMSRQDLARWADEAPVFTGPLSSTVDYPEYCRSFDEVNRALASGTTYQVNLTLPLTGKALASGPWTWTSALRLWLDLIAAQGREASFAVLGGPDQAEPILVSASPELFFRLEGPVVEARPMKGTASRYSDPAHDAASRHELSVSAKTRAENLMVTDMLRNDLGRLAVAGGVSVPRLFEVEEYPTVWQMTSTVRAELVDPSLTALMAALFPCASITGAPKLSTQAVIARAESWNRGWYTGTLGWYRPASPVGGPTRARFSVLIRTLVFEDAARPEFVLGVGGGVVWDSTADGEWDEAWAKARFLQPTKRTFDLTEAVLWTPEGGLALLPEHEARLTAACRAFGGDLEVGRLEAALTAAVLRHGEGASPGPLKLRVLVDPAFRLRVEAEPLSPMRDSLIVALADRPFGEESLPFRRFKTTFRGVYDQARVPGVDQTLHFNQRGELTESTSMNLIVEKNGQFLTPALSCGLLDGTFRSRLLAEGKIEEAILPVGVLTSADRLWLVNSVRGWKSAVLVEAP